MCTGMPEFRSHGHTHAVYGRYLCAVTLSSRVSAGATTPRQMMVVLPRPQTDTRVSSSMSARPMDLKKEPFPRWLPMLRNRRTVFATLLAIVPNYTSGIGKPRY